MPVWTATEEEKRTIEDAVNGQQESKARIDYDSSAKHGDVLACRENWWEDAPVHNDPPVSARKCGTCSLKLLSLCRCRTCSEAGHQIDDNVASVDPLRNSMLETLKSIIPSLSRVRSSANIIRQRF